ncbi:MAG: thiamine phosphate synthase [Gemmatimonadota bacterium]|jgi:thiazole tautomerase (transcriptional regulator TenI)
MSGRADLPRLHVITSDDVLRAPGFLDRARALVGVHGPAMALHVRGHGLGGRELLAIVRGLAGASTLLVNDRLDVALATDAGAQIGCRSLPVAAARRLLPDRWLGYSAHAAQEAEDAVRAGADFVVLGTIFATPSHPGWNGSGTGLVRETARVAPVIAIGGITPERVEPCLAAGARGVAVLGGVWRTDDPVAAVTSYLDALDRAVGPGGRRSACIDGEAAVSGDRPRRGEGP